MRYADVLLMNAEAINELEGPTKEAQESLRQVRGRAFDDQGAVILTLPMQLLRKRNSSRPYWTNVNGSLQVKTSAGATLYVTTCTVRK